MMSSAGARRLLLTVHVIASVGWLGSIASFLALALAGLWARDPLLVRGAYVVPTAGRRGIVVLALLATVVAIHLAGGGFHHG